MAGEPAPLTTRLGLRRPLLVAPMAGGPTTVALVAAASEAGALGAVGAACYTARQIDAFVADVRGLTGRPFSINLFVPHPEPRLTRDQIDAAGEGALWPGAAAALIDRLYPLA